MNVFISHASADREFAEELADALEARRYTVWTDRNVLPGDNWARAIDRALREADLMVALVSSAAAQSDWVKREWEYALGSEKFAGRLIPVVLGDVSDAETPWVFEKLASLRAKSARWVAEQVVLRAEAGPKGSLRAGGRENG